MSCDQPLPRHQHRPQLLLQHQHQDVPREVRAVPKEIRCDSAGANELAGGVNALPATPRATVVQRQHQQQAGDPGLASQRARAAGEPPRGLQW